MPAPIDYLILGHLACDVTPQGLRLGGTAAYAGLTAHALGQRVGLVTAWGGELPLDSLAGLQVQTVTADHSATFENLYTSAGRQQILHHVAPDLSLEDVPEEWRATPIVHVGPIAGEAKSLADGQFPTSMLALTPQGWMRAWDESGHIHSSRWLEATTMLPKVGAAVMSLEDVGGDEEQIEALALACRILAVTEGAAGARLYWNGDLRRFPAPHVPVVDSTGAGDIFAAAFFWRLHATRDPWAAASFATRLAACSVQRRGLEGIPTPAEIQSCLVEVI